ncbi:hypothetical protein [Tropicibacter sp. Alg240-R139]|uniref:hypothetical protein n=1 Tax=Tropicibacter sp. Alg240-R139 TaxID=2305991 RepID=UPI001F08831A|nr:hypothetical protein [Tropicibacter sp. Alg240-R139]
MGYSNWNWYGYGGSKSYHNGGVEGDSFSDWYDAYLYDKYCSSSDDTKGSGSGGTKGSGSGGTKGSGSGGTKGSGSGGTKGSGSGGTKGSGSGGTKGSGSGGTKGSGSGGTKGSGSGGTKGSGSGGTKGSGSGGTKGSGSGGTKGSGSGGTKGSGSGGTKGSGSGGTKGSGSGGTKGSESDGGDKTKVTFQVGDDPQVTVEISALDTGELFIRLSATEYDGTEGDIDGFFFNMTDDSEVSALNFFPSDGERGVTGHQANANSVTNLANGFTVSTAYDAAFEFGDTDEAAGEQEFGEETYDINFTLWSDNGALTLDDIDLDSIAVAIDTNSADAQLLTASDAVNAGASTSDAYHNGGVEGDGLDDWYDKSLSDKYSDSKGSGSGGTKGSGSGGTKGSGSGGTKGSGSGGTKGSGSGGTKGSGSGGTKGSGSGGTKGSGSGGTKGSGSGGTKGSGSGGTKGSGSGGTKGSGSGGTKGSGSGGTKGSGSGGTKGSGSGGTKGSGNDLPKYSDDCEDDEYSYGETVVFASGGTSGGAKSEDFMALMNKGTEDLDDAHSDDKWDDEEVDDMV